MLYSIFGLHKIARKPRLLRRGCPQKNNDFSGTLEKSLLFHANGSGYLCKKTNHYLFSAQKGDFYHIFCVTKCGVKKAFLFKPRHLWRGETLSRTFMTS